MISRISPGIGPILLLVVLAITITAPAQAGTRVDLVPALAYFNPTANVIDEQGVTAKFAGGVGAGGRLAIWLNESVALEGSGYFVGSSLDGQIPGGTEGSIDATLFYGAAQVVVGLGTEKRFLIHGGIGMQGTNYDELIEGGNIMTGVFGIGGWAPLSETVAIRADLDIHIHTMYFEFGDLQSEELTQYDMILSFGIQFSPDGR